MASVDKCCEAFILPTVDCLSFEDVVFVVILGSNAKEEESLWVCIHSKDRSIIAMKSIDLVRLTTVWHFLCLRRRRKGCVLPCVSGKPSCSFVDILMIPCLCRLSHARGKQWLLGSIEVRGSSSMEYNWKSFNAGQESVVF